MYVCLDGVRVRLDTEASCDGGRVCLRRLRG